MRQPTNLKSNILANPAIAGDAIAQVFVLIDNKEVLIGQAWLAKQNALITAGHVVEQYAESAQGLFVRFPSSGNTYPIVSVKLHPSFVRQKDGLVRFDVALLGLSLKEPELSKTPLPFSFEKSLKANQVLTSIRYPVHLGQLSAAAEPLVQQGKLLGYLRKHDNFHLLHDLPLAKGDSGTPIFDGDRVIAIHCGDTATIPGLNLPTTSIRLALWIDALRELGLAPSKITQGVNKLSSGKMAILFIASILISAVITILISSFDIEKQWQIQQPAVMPVQISFNKPLHNYQRQEDIEISVLPNSDCYFFMFLIDQQNNAVELYPPYGVSSLLHQGEGRTINRFGRRKLTATPDPASLHILAIDANDLEAKSQAANLISEADWAENDKADRPLLLKGQGLIKRLQKIQSESPKNAIYSVIDAPKSK